MPTNETIRTSFGWFSALSAATCILVTIYTVFTVKNISGIPPLVFNAITTKSIETRLGLAQTLFQLAFLMIGALWALLIAKKDEIALVFAKHAEVVMFISASVVLVLSATTYAFYVDKVSSQFADAAQALAGSGLDYVPNIFDQNVNYLFILQIISLIVGTINAVLTLISAHRLR